MKLPLPEKEMLKKIMSSNATESSDNVFRRLKQEKIDKIRQIVRPGLTFKESPLHLDFLSDALREKYAIVATDNVSANEYDPFALDIIQQNEQGLVLDCGAGKRSSYLANVVNFEIVPYDTTDVLGVGEELPFADHSFDAVLSLNFLEHVKNPFQCAAEIARVMKPGAKLYCVVPFLQPLHAYPHHYYNMTSHGLKNLFDGMLTVDRQEVVASGLPIWTLSWILGSWVHGLQGEVREAFLKMTVADFLGSPMYHYLRRDFVTQLSEDKNFELASTTALFATKPA